jgi:rhamnosyltransferase
VVVLTKNPGPRFRQVLDAVLGQRHPSFEVVAVDSGSTDGTVELLEAASVSLHRIPPESFGHGRTRNLAAAAARGDHVAFLTHDAVPRTPSWLEHLVAPLDDAGVAGAYGRQVARPSASPLECHFNSHMYPPVDRELELDPGRPFKIAESFFSNVNSALRRSTWERFPFPEDVVMSEDQWWARSVLGAGLRIAYVAAAEVEHSHDYRLSELFRRNFDSGASLRGLDQTPRTESLRLLARYLASEARWLRRSGRSALIPAAVVREVVRASGFAAGQHAGRLPPPLRSALSMHPDHWER